MASSSYKMSFGSSPLILLTLVDSVGLGSGEVPKSVDYNFDALASNKWGTLDQ